MLTEIRSILSKSAMVFGPFQIRPLQHPEQLAMVRHFQVQQLVHDYLAAEVGRLIQQIGVEGQVAF